MTIYHFDYIFRFKFRPVNDNPYLHLPDEEEDDEEDIEMNQMYVFVFYLFKKFLKFCVVKVTVTQSVAEKYCSFVNKIIKEIMV